MIQGLRNLIFDIFSSHVSELIDTRPVCCCFELKSTVVFLEKFLTSLVSKFRAGHVVSFPFYTFLKLPYEAGIKRSLVC